LVLIGSMMTRLGNPMTL